MNNKYIAWILFLIIVITFINLFYKEPIFNYYSIKTQDEFIHDSIFDSMKTKLCPIQGFKCSNIEFCDCAKLCGYNYIKFNVGKTDSIYVMSRKLGPGTYCLPSGIHDCNFQTSIPMFSTTGWSCIPLNSTIFGTNEMIACKNEEAADNSLNILWDTVENKPAEDVENYYEPNRYRCKCRSKTVDGIAQITLSQLPFRCVTDYCLKDIKDPLPGMGWNGQYCDCLLYKNANENDKTSPCVMEASELKDNLYTASIKCMTKDSITYSPIFCPGDEEILNYLVPIVPRKDNLKYPEDYVESVIKPYNFNFKKNELLDNFYSTLEVDRNY